MTAGQDEARARRIVDALIEDIRDRKTIKWFFPRPDEGEGATIGGLLPVAQEAQQQIRDAWTAVLLPALSEARDQGARELQDWEIPCDVRVAPLTVVAHGNTLATLIRAIKERGDMIAQGIATPDLSAPAPAIAPPREAVVPPEPWPGCGHEYVRFTPGSTDRVCMLCGTAISSAQGWTAVVNTENKE